MAAGINANGIEGVEDVVCTKWRGIENWPASPENHHGIRNNAVAFPQMGYLGEYSNACDLI